LGLGRRREPLYPEKRNGFGPFTPGIQGTQDSSVRRLRTAVKNAEREGAYLKSALESIRANCVKEVRGRGLMLAIELHPEAGGARRHCEALAARGVLAIDAHDHTIRISPPLAIAREETDWALEQIENALKSAKIHDCVRALI
jgi:acetylornithine/succinyldiaminopimelate/putrescine aminotransferase